MNNLLNQFTSNEFISLIKIRKVPSIGGDKSCKAIKIRL